MRANLAQRDKKKSSDESKNGRQFPAPKQSSTVITSTTMDNETAGPYNASCIDEHITKHPAYQKLHRALRDYQAKECKLEALNQDWKRKNQRLQQQIIGYRQNTQTQRCIKLEKDLSQNKVLFEELSVKLGDSEAELLRTKGTLKERDAAIQSMKDEYNKLFLALQKAKPLGSHSPTRLLQATSSMGVLKAATNGCASLSKSTTSNNLKLMTSTSAVDDGGTFDGPGEHEDTELHVQANDNPYLISHYKFKIEQLEKSIEGLQMQIRKMIASEYRHKQKNRVLLTERAQLLDYCDKLRRELDNSVLAAAKTITNTQKQQTARDMERRLSWSAITSRMDPQGSCVSGVGGLSKSSSSTTVGEVKRLRQRNEFLEERFRCILRAAGTSNPQTASVRPASATGVTRPHVFTQGAHIEDEDDVSEEGDHFTDELKRHAPRKSSNVQLDTPLLTPEAVSADASKPRIYVGSMPAFTEAGIVAPALHEAADSALAPTMLQQLQRVERKARVRI